MIDAAMFNMQKLIECMFQFNWQHQCEIIPDYMPPYPGKDTQPKCVVKFGGAFLRYSAGPMQGYFWDCYGEDFIDPELALMALAHAPPPPRISCFSSSGRAFEPALAVEPPPG